MKRRTLKAEEGTMARMATMPETQALLAEQWHRQGNTGLTTEAGGVVLWDGRVLYLLADGSAQVAVLRLGKA